MSEFDDDTRLERVESGVYRGALTERWSIGPVPNGGYVLAVAVGAIQDALGAADPVSVTAHFLRPASPGEVEVHVEVAKRGKSYSTASARVVQAGKERLRVLGTFGDLSRAAAGPVHVSAQPPEVPPRTSPALVRPPEARPAIAERFDMHLAPETMRWLDGETGESAEIRGWVRFRDRRMPDPRSLVLLADALPPPVFNVIPPAWVPTLELTVHVRARPTSEWLRVVFRTRFLFGGHLEEDGEIWDEDGTLVAQSRQIATVPR